MPQSYMVSFSFTVTYKAVHMPHTHIDIGDDCMRGILQHTCCMNARRRTRPLEARLAFGEDSRLVNISPYKVIDANGIIGKKKTILFDVTSTLGGGNGDTYEEIGGYMTWASQMVKGTQETPSPGDLVFVDTIGDEEYYDERSRAGQDWESVGDGPWLFPCLGWGSHTRVSYSLCLSRALSVRVEFHVHIVPTSWWVDDCEGTFFVVQLIDAEKEVPLPRALSCYGYSKTEGYKVVGWTSAQTEQTDSDSSY